MVKEINSGANKNYKLCMQLAFKKYRDKYGLYLIEGCNLMAEAISCGAAVESVFIREGGVNRTDLPCGEPYVLNKKLFDAAAQTEASQGIIAIVKKREYSEDEFFDICGKKNILVLDRLQDPGNIGTMLRTAEASGYGGVIILKGTGDIFAPKTVRAAAGSIFRLPALFKDTPAEAVALLKAGGKRLVSACPAAGTPYYETELKENTALLIGNEGNGLCGELAECSDIKVKIPMEPGVDSLNAAVAAGILMYESRRMKDAKPVS